MRRSRRDFMISRDESYRDCSPMLRKECHAEIWGAALVTAAGAAYGANQQREAGRDAARGGAAATALDREMYEQQRRDLMPYMQAGQGALTQLQDLNAGDFSSFTESPDYTFARDQGIKALDRSASSRGTQYSGGQLAALADFSGGLASQNYGDYYNRIAQLAGLGQSSAAGVGNAGMGFASRAGGYLTNAANARADSRIAQASTYGQLGEQLGGAFGRWYQGRQPSGGTGTADWERFYYGN